MRRKTQTIRFGKKQNTPLKMLEKQQKAEQVKPGIKPKMPLINGKPKKNKKNIKIVLKTMRKIKIAPNHAQVMPRKAKIRNLALLTRRKVEIPNLHNVNQRAKNRVNNGLTRLIKKSPLACGLFLFVFQFGNVVKDSDLLANFFSVCQATRFDDASAFIHHPITDFNAFIKKGLLCQPPVCIKQLRGTVRTTV